MSLPNRITCQQDIEDIFDHFQNEANSYLAARIPHEHAPVPGRFFISPHNLRYISDHQLEQMQRMFSDFHECLYAQWLINIIGNVKNILMKKEREKIKSEEIFWLCMQRELQQRVQELFNPAEEEVAVTEGT